MEAIRISNDTYYDADNPTELIPHPNPPQSFLDGLREGGQRITHGMAHFLYYAVAPGSRMGYNSYIKSWTRFCRQRNYTIFPASEQTLGEWVALCGEGSAEESQKILKADSILAALAAVRRVHVERRLPLDIFNTLWIKDMINGIRFCQGTPDKKKALSLSVSQLEMITSPAPSDSEDKKPLGLAALDQLHYDAALKTGYGGFFRTGEFIYEKRDLDDPKAFAERNLLRSDIHFADNDKHAIVSLRATR